MAVAEAVGDAAAADETGCRPRYTIGVVDWSIDEWVDWWIGEQRTSGVYHMMEVSMRNAQSGNEHFIRGNVCLEKGEYQ